MGHALGRRVTLLICKQTLFGRVILKIRLMMGIISVGDTEFLSMKELRNVLDTAPNIFRERTILIVDVALSSGTPKV